MKTAKKTAKKTTKKLKPFVIIRSYVAGVHAGYLESREGDTVILSDSRRLWKWYGASLSQVAVHGLSSGDNRIAVVVPKTEIISPQGFEIIHCSEEGKASIQGYTPWKV